MNRSWSLQCAAARCILAATVAASSLAASAQSVPDALREQFVPPELRQQMLRAEHQRRPVPAAPADRPIDTTPPSLVGFNAAAKSINAKSTTDFVPVKVHLTDDLSGISYYQITAMSPSGQTASAYGNSAYASIEANTTLQFRVSSYSEPGTWQIFELYAVDFAGNYAYFDQTELAALGNTTFTVKNSSYDLVAPTIGQGRILTPTVSLTAPAAGVPDGTYSQFAGVTLQVADTGTTATSGVSYAYIVFCLPDGFGNCLDTISLNNNNTSNTTGPTSATLTFGETIYQGQGSHQTGIYRLYAVNVQDVAGNSAYYLSTAFGGSTDFKTLFSTTTIRITP